MRQTKTQLTYLFLLFTFLTAYAQTMSSAEDIQQYIRSLSFDSLTFKVNEYSQVGKNVKGLPYFHACLDSMVARRMTDSIDFPLLLNTTTYAYELKGDYDQAELYYQKTLSAYERIVGKEHPNYIVQLSYYGDFLKVKGDYKAAEPVLVQALNLAKKHSKNFKNRVDYAATFGFLANFYRQSTHEYDKALPLYLEQVPIYEKEIGEEHIEYGALLSNLAITYDLLGLYEKAIGMLKKALMLTEKYHGTNTFQYGQRAHNLASIYSKMAKYTQEADSLHLISIENVRQLMGENHPEYAYRKMTYAAFLFQIQSYQEAVDIQEHALKLLSNFLPSDHPAFVKANINYSKILWHVGQVDQAREVLLDAIAYEKEDSFQFVEHYLGFLRRSEWLFEALKLTDLIPVIYGQLNAYNTRIVNKQFDYFNELQQLNFAKSLKIDFDRFESYAFRNKSEPNVIESCYENQLLLKGLTLKNVKDFKTAFWDADKVIKEEFELWQILKEQLAKQYALAPAKRSSDFDELVVRADELEGKLARKSLLFRNNNTTDSWTAIRDALSEGEIAIEFSHFQHYPSAQLNLDNRVFYVAYLLKKDYASPKMIFLFEGNDLKYIQRTKSMYQFNPNANNLNSLIWNPLADELDGVKRIYFAPSGILNRVNLGAIPISEKEVLADHFELHQMGSTRQLVYKQKVEKLNTASAFIFGGIRYETQNQPTDNKVESVPSLDYTMSLNIGNAYRGFRKREWEYLEWTAQEVFDIQELLEKANKKTQLKTAYEANEANFKQVEKNGNAPKIIHLATHAYFFPKIDTTANAGFQSSKNPLIRSGLILAGANAAWTGKTTPEGQEDGILTAYEIAQMDLSGTELVVLSACDTGLGVIEGNEGVYGLQRAFKMAGVKYILMSLWSVKDQKTYEFMTTFYEHLMEHNAIPAAYRFSQQQMREKYALPFNPRNWAGFVLLE